MDIKSHELYATFDKLAKKYNWKIDRLSNGSKAYTFGRGSRISILSGVHGDEKSGPYSLVDMVSKDYKNLPIDNFEFWILPLLNVDGWDANKRNLGRYNLNRQFRKDSKTVTVEVIELLTKKVPICFIDLHEDNTSTYNYLWKYTNNKKNFVGNVAKNLNVKTIAWDDSFYGGNKISSEEFAISLGVPETVTTEANPRQSLRARITFQKDCIKECIKFIENNYH